MQRLVITLVDWSTRALAARSRSRSRSLASALEQGRWMRLLGLDFFAGALFLVALFASGVGWLGLGVFVCWPLAGSLTAIYLGMSSDTNGVQTVTAGTPPRGHFIQALNAAIQARLERSARSARHSGGTANSAV